MSAEQIRIDALAVSVLRLTDDVLRHSPDTFLHAMARQTVRMIPEDVRVRLEHLNRKELGLSLAEGLTNAAAHYERMCKILEHARKGKEAE